MVLLPSKIEVAPKTTRLETRDMNNSKTEDWTPTDEEIACRAYALFEARGGAPGAACDDWLAAEEQLRAEHAPLPGPPGPSPSRGSLVDARR